MKKKQSGVPKNEPKVRPSQKVVERSKAETKATKSTKGSKGTRAPVPLTKGTTARSSKDNSDRQSKLSEKSSKSKPAVSKKPTKVVKRYREDVGNAVISYSANAPAKSITKAKKVEGEKCPYPTKQKSTQVIATTPFATTKPSGDSSKSLLSSIKVKRKHLPNIVVEARAGCGKTFTLIVGVAWAFGQSIWPEIQREMARRINEKRKATGEHLLSVEKFRVNPSPEQMKVWEALAEGKDTTKSIIYCAFNKSIVKEFSDNWGWMAKMLEKVGVSLQFSTVNSLGHKACSNQLGRFCINNYNPEEVLSRVYGNVWELKKTPGGKLFVEAVVSLIDLCKLTLAGWEEGRAFNADHITDEELDNLVGNFDIDVGNQRGNIYKAVRLAISACHDLKDEHCSLHQIDYNDQNWLPIVNEMPVNQVDLLMVDEAQDLPRCKQEFVRLMGRRIAIVGDVNQAIYGFAGADVNSIPRMKALLNVETSLSLTKTYRCGKAIVREANTIVEDFYANDDNPEGSIIRVKTDQYQGFCQDGDMVLCRVNAPLISQALKFLKDGRKVIVRGKDFGKSLIKFIESFQAQSVKELLQQIYEWAEHESRLERSKKNFNEQKLISIADKKACIEAFCEYDPTDPSEMTIPKVVKRIERIFAGKQCSRCHRAYDDDAETCFKCQCDLVKPTGITFSSIHKAKGLEASRVVLLEPVGAGVPHPMAKTQAQIAQEWNCRYIAITRAINELILAKD